MTVALALRIDPDRLAKFEGAHLLRGSHNGDTGKTGEGCYNEWASFLAGEPHSFQPACVDPVIRAMTIYMNDEWPEAERDRMKRFVVPGLGTAGGAALETKRAIAAIDWVMRVHRPLRLDAAGLSEFAARLRALPEIIDEPSWKIAQTIVDEALKAAWAACAAWAAGAALRLVAVKEYERRGFNEHTPADTLRKVGMEAFETVACKVRDAELELLDRLIKMGSAAAAE